MQRFLLAALALLLAAPLAGQHAQEFHSRAHYTLQLPAAWQPLPEVELNRLRASAPNGTIGRWYEAAYHTTRSTQRVPLMAIATVDLGATLTRDQFRAEVTGAAAQAQMQSTTDATIRPGHSANLAMPVWDEENGAVWTRVAYHSDQQHPPFSLSVAMLHADGHSMINLVYIAAPGQDENRVRAELLAVVRSLHMDQ